MTTALPIKIRKINKANISAVKKLVTDVFMEFEAPDYSYEGVKAFFWGDYSFRNLGSAQTHKAYQRCHYCGEYKCMVIF